MSTTPPVILLEVSTHTNGHIRDLVITDSAPISNLQVYDLGVSDHEVVSMALTFTLPTVRPSIKCHSGTGQALTQWL